MKYFTRLLLCFVWFAAIPSTLLLVAIVSSRHYAESQLFAASSEAIQAGSDEVAAELVDILAMMNALAADQSIVTYLVDPSAQNLVAANRRLYYHTGGRTGSLSAYVLSADHRFSIGNDSVPALYRQPIRSGWGILRMIQESPDIVMRPTEHSINESRETVFSLGRQVTADGRIAGYLVVDIKRPFLEARYPNMSDAATYIYQGNNLIYNSADQDQQGLGRLPALIKAENVSGILQRGGVTFSIARTHILDGVLSVAQMVNMKSVDQTFYYVKVGYLVTIVVLLIICPIIAYYVARSVTRPIVTVTSALRQVESGNLDIRINLNRTDEIGQLEDGFNEMAAQIRELLTNVREKQHELDIAQNRALLAQVNPHFLYNTLDLIKWAAKMNDNETVRQTAVNLGRLLRAIVNIEADVIPVERELAITRYYIDIQKLRYGSRLDYQEDIPDALLDKPIPRLLFQPLVENAIEHGLQGKDGVGTLLIRGRQQGRYLVFEIVDNGPGFPDGYVIQPPESRTEALKGIGLSNVHRRAQLYSDDRCGLSIGRDEDGNTVVTVTVLDASGPSAS